MKIDCEGCEFSVINDKSALLFKRVKKIVLEYHENEDRKKERLESILTREKFKVSFFPRKGVPNIGLLIAEKNV